MSSRALPQIDWRRAINEWPPRDADGVVPHPFTWVTFFRSMPWMRDLFTDVPGTFWTLDIDDEDEDVAIVACPCGAEPKVRLSSCVQCVCERFYLATATRVLVARPEEVEAGIPKEAPSVRVD